ncbi:MAG: MarR family transcriptional regulator [Bacteroidales bacterium]
MGTEVNELVSLFLSILHTFSIIEKKPWDLGTSSKIFLTEIQTVSMIGENPNVNMTQLADIMGVTRGAISQTVRKLVTKKLVVRTNARNNKEVNLALTSFGQMVSDTYQTRMKEVFTFADELYASATPVERDLVKRLFLRIHSNMKNRIQ